MRMRNAVGTRLLVVVFVVRNGLLGGGALLGLRGGSGKGGVDSVQRHPRATQPRCAHGGAATTQLGARARVLRPHVRRAAAVRRARPNALRRPGAASRPRGAALAMPPAAAASGFVPWRPRPPPPLPPPPPPPRRHRRRRRRHRLRRRPRRPRRPPPPPPRLPHRRRGLRVPRVSGHRAAPRGRAGGQKLTRALHGRASAHPCPLWRLWWWRRRRCCCAAPAAATREAHVSSGATSLPWCQLTWADVGHACSTARVGRCGAFATHRRAAGL